MRGSAALRTGITPGGALAGPWVCNPLWTAARAVPSLDLRFADNKSLTDATTGQNLVTFTRASSGTYVDSQGVIKTATTNLLLRSEEFDNASWVKTLATVTANVTTAPNGSVAADKLIGNSTIDSHYAQQNISGATNGISYTSSVYAKASEITRIEILHAVGATLYVQGYDLSSGTLLTRVTAGTTAATGGFIQAVGNGWYRCGITQTSDGTTGAVRVTLRSANTVNFDATSQGVLLWGAQLEASSTVGEYIPTTSTINSAPRFDHNPTTGESLGLLVEEQRTNLVTSSATFQPSSASNPASYTVDQVAPDGTTTASRQTAANPRTFIDYQGIANAQYTFSVYAKAASGTVTIALHLKNALSDTVITAGSNVTLTTAWQRLTVTGTTNGATTGARIEAIGPVVGAPAGTVFWGAQLEAGSSPTSYIPTTTATVTRSADVASITGSNFGVSRTNLLLRSEEFDNASWGTKTDVVVTADTTGTLAPNGTATAEFVVANTTNGQHRIAQTVTTAAQTYTFSVFVKAAGYSWVVLYANAGNSGRHFNLQNGTIGQQTGNANTAAIQSVGNGWYRCSIVYTAAAASNLLICNIADADGNFSFAGNNTSGIYLWGAQLETGSAATAYIPTTSAAVTVVDSPWYRQDEGTVFTDTVNRETYPGVNVFPYIIQIDDGTNNNRISHDNSVLNSGYRYNLPCTSGGVSQGELNQFGFASGAARWASAFRTNDFALAINLSPSVVSTRTSGTLPNVMTQLRIGAGFGKQFTGTIRRLVYFPQRLPNEVLQRITQ